MADFKSAYEEGRFKEAALIFDDHAGQAEPPDMVMLAARAHIHSAPSAVIKLLLDLKLPKTRLHELAERDALLGEAFARTKDFKSADDRLNAALAAARQAGDDDLLATVGYRFVRRHLQAADPASARAALALARQGRSAKSRIFALWAEILILPYEERVREQADRLIELLRLIDPGSPTLMNLRAWGTHALAMLARELYLPEAIPEIERQLGGVPWSKDFNQNLFQTLKALGWAKALQGDYFNAFRHLKRATAVADTEAWKVVAACDRSYLARCLGERGWSRQELDEAEQGASDVDWHATQGEERTGLLLLAELFSSLDSSRSAMYLARYRELGEIKSPLHFGADGRIAAFAQYSTGVVEIALGNKKRGLAELRQALKTFERFGYDFRIARCLVTEYEVTGNDDLLPLAVEKLRDYGQSWLAADMRAIGEQPGGIALPPAQKRVFDEVCQGKSTAEIAKALDRSEFTINNHLKEIFKAFKVKSRSALFAEAVRRGLIKPV
jgi:DNA-binding CsgD family transcriptional regulator